jgi:predicted  nucleic acid-binding Zn-ribbon protein
LIEEKEMLPNLKDTPYALIILFLLVLSSHAQVSAQERSLKREEIPSSTIKTPPISSPTKSLRKNKPSLKNIPRKKFKISKNKIPVVKKNIKTKKLSSNLVKTSSEIKALKNKLLLVTAQLKTVKKSDTQKGIKIKKLQSESTKFSGKIKALEKNLSLAKNELEGLKETNAKKSEELIKLNENVNFLLDSIDDQEAELTELSIHSGTSEKYKEIIKCYRSALFAWNNLISRQGLTEEEYLVVRVELRRSLFACPAI